MLGVLSVGLLPHLRNDQVSYLCHLVRVLDSTNDYLALVALLLQVRRVVGLAPLLQALLLQVGRVGRHDRSHPPGTGGTTAALKEGRGPEMQRASSFMPLVPALVWAGAYGGGGQRRLASALGCTNAHGACGRRCKARRHACSAWPPWRTRGGRGRGGGGGTGRQKRWGAGGGGVSGTGRSGSWAWAARRRGGGAPRRALKCAAPRVTSPDPRPIPAPPRPAQGAHRMLLKTTNIKMGVRLGLLNQDQSKALIFEVDPSKITGKQARRARARARARATGGRLSGCAGRGGRLSSRRAVFARSRPYRLPSQRAHSLARSHVSRPPPAAPALRRPPHGPAPRRRAPRHGGHHHNGDRPRQHAAAGRGQQGQGTLRQRLRQLPAGGGRGVFGARALGRAAGGRLLLVAVNRGETRRWPNRPSSPTPRPPLHSTPNPTPLHSTPNP
jgi:hypothetical protein